MKRLAIVLAVIGCGGGDGDVAGSGVDPALPLGMLAAAEIDAVCGYGVALSRPVDCNGTQAQSVTTLDACQDLLEALAETCPATVAELEACFEALAAESDPAVCDLDTPPACAFLGDPACLDL